MRLVLVCRTLALLSLLILSLPRPAAAQEAQIQGVIRQQLNAFMVDDFATAFTFASPTIHAIFGSPENFGRMVAQGYPMVHRPGEVRMGDLSEERGLVWQRVEIFDRDGRKHLLDYQMVQTPEGVWLINAVEYLGSEGLGA